MGTVAQRTGMPLFTHIRYSSPEPPGKTSLDALDEALRVAEQTGVKLHIDHIPSMCTHLMPEAVAKIDDARSKGLDVTGCFYPYTFWGTYLASARFSGDWQSRFRITYHDLQLAGSSERLTESSFQKYKAQNKLVVAYAIPQEDVNTCLAADWAMIGSDAIPESSLNNHPRGAGCFSRLLGPYVRDLKVLGLMDALRKCTILPARNVEGRVPMMQKKGRMQIGADADITVFDPTTIADTSTVENPASLSAGIDHVLVMGKVALDPSGAQARRVRRPAGQGPAGLILRRLTRPAAGPGRAPRPRSPRRRTTASRHRRGRWRPSQPCPRWGTPVGTSGPACSARAGPDAGPVPAAPALGRATPTGSDERTAVDALDLARWQFGATTVFHYLFVPLTIGLSAIVAVMQTMWHRTDDPVYLRMTKFFGKLLLINFALGVVTGIVQEFQFGMNWSSYSRMVGDIFGAPLAMEALLAFFLESTFLGLWIFGWDKLPRRLHLATIWAVAVGTALSASFIIAANSWMQHPVGYVFNPVHRAGPSSPASSTSSPTRPSWSPTPT